MGECYLLYHCSGNGPDMTSLRKEGLILLPVAECSHYVRQGTLTGDCSGYYVIAKVRKQSQR